MIPAFPIRDLKYSYFVLISCFYTKGSLIRVFPEKENMYHTHKYIHSYIPICIWDLFHEISLFRCGGRLNKSKVSRTGSQEWESISILEPHSHELEPPCTGCGQEGRFKEKKKSLCRPSICLENLSLGMLKVVQLIQ